MPTVRRLAAILAADVAGYSRLMGADEEGTLERLKAHRSELTDPKIKEHHGRIVKTTGDGLLVEFPSVVDAVRCAVEVQRGMLDRNAETLEDKRIAFRIGINLGDVIIDGDDIYGDGVNIAARLEALSEPGGICISRVVRDQIRDKLPLPVRGHGRAESQEHRPPGARVHDERRYCRINASGYSAHAAGPRQKLAAVHHSDERRSAAVHCARSLVELAQRSSADCCSSSAFDAGCNDGSKYFGAAPVFCCSAVRELIAGPGPGIFRRGNHGRSDDRPVADIWQLRHRAQHRLHVQREAHRRKADWPRA
jgi:class 3 adenylate cyclase